MSVQASCIMHSGQWILRHYVAVWHDWIATFRVSDIPTHQLQFKFSRASGPGGQNVNKVNTKVDLRLQVQKALWIPIDIRERLILQNASKMNHLGEIVIQSQTFRTQEANRAACLEKLYALLVQASQLEPSTRPEMKERLEALHLKAKNENRRQKEKRACLKENRKKWSF